jgi:hypothetical protein
MIHGIQPYVFWDMFNCDHQQLLGIKKHGICNKPYNQFFVHEIFGISHVLYLNILFWIGINSPMASSTLNIFFLEMLKIFP